MKTNMNASERQITATANIIRNIYREMEMMGCDTLYSELTGECIQKNELSRTLGILTGLPLITDMYNYGDAVTEMERLEKLLTDAKIPFEKVVDHWYQTPHIYYPKGNEFVCSVICHKYSYGYEEGLLEIMGLTESEDDVEGYLNAVQVFSRIKAHYEGK